MKKAIVVLVLGSTFVGPVAHASPTCAVGSGTIERDVAQAYGECWQDLYLWAWKAYQLNDSTFTNSDAGFDDACNYDKSFAKMANAAYALNYSLSDNYIPQWHSQNDYTNASVAFTPFHGPYYSRQLLSGGNPQVQGRAELGRFLARDRINYYCPLFSPGNQSDSPVERAGVMLHEAWHHWQKAKNYNPEHPKCRNGYDCDYYYFHGSGMFEFGHLNDYTRDGRYFHSPYQIQVEWLTDAAENSNPATFPDTASQDARLRANLRTNTKFVNVVPWRIGQPRPF